MAFPSTLPLQDGFTPFQTLLARAIQTYQNRLAQDMQKNCSDTLVKPIS